MNSRKSKFLDWINYRVRVILTDSRHMVGTLLAFDKHVNLVLADTEEFTRIKSKKDKGVDREVKRALGLIILRGENIISFSAESPPSKNNELFENKNLNLDGKSMPINRNINLESNNEIKLNPIMPTLSNINMNTNLSSNQNINMQMNMPNIPNIGINSNSNFNNITNNQNHIVPMMKNPNNMN